MYKAIWVWYCTKCSRVFDSSSEFKERCCPEHRSSLAKLIQVNSEDVAPCCSSCMELSDPPCESDLPVEDNRHCEDCEYSCASCEATFFAHPDARMSCSSCYEYLCKTCYTADVQMHGIAGCLKCHQEDKCNCSCKRRVTSEVSVWLGHPELISKLLCDAGLTSKFPNIVLHTIASFIFVKS
jgi:hypothetical protein